MIQTNLVYLDTSFIIEAYESTTQMRVPVTITKTTDKSGGIAAGIFNLGASSQETREFPFSSRHMYAEIKSSLDHIPSVDLLSIGRSDFPDLFWADGEFSVGSSHTTSKGEEIHRDEYFRFYPKGDPKKGVTLLAKDTYFSAGYEQVLEHIYGAARGFAIPARILVKTLAIQESGFWPLCAPLIILKIGTS